MSYLEAWDMELRNIIKGFDIIIRCLLKSLYKILKMTV